MTYILITPAKDEENNLPTLIESVANQTFKPVAWFIVDDSSEDKTPEIIERTTSQYPWIHSLRLTTKRAYDIGKHYAFVCIKGFEHALEYCQQNNLHYEYIALSDADMIYPKDYFAKCIKFLQQNDEFGIVSGRILIRNNKGEIYEENRILLGDAGGPLGTGRVWKKQTFMDTNGYILTKSPDSVSNMMALLRGWRIVQLDYVEYYQTRDTGGKISLWNGYFNRGERAYYLNANPLNIFNTIIAMLFISREKHSVVKSLAFLVGYLRSLVRRDDQIENDEIKRYAGSYKKVLRNYRLFLRHVVRGIRKRIHYRK